MKKSNLVHANEIITAGGSEKYGKTLGGDSRVNGSAEKTVWARMGRGFIFGEFIKELQRKGGEKLR